jgi:hypothetical protein
MLEISWPTRTIALRTSSWMCADWVLDLWPDDRQEGRLLQDGHGHRPPHQQQEIKGERLLPPKRTTFCSHSINKRKSRTAPLPPTPIALYSGMTVLTTTAPLSALGHDYSDYDSPCALDSDMTILTTAAPPRSALGHDYSDYDGPPTLCTRAWVFWLRQPPPPLCTWAWLFWLRRPPPALCTRAWLFWLRQPHRALHLGITILTMIAPQRSASGMTILTMTVPPRSALWHDYFWLQQTPLAVFRHGQC